VASGDVEQRTVTIWARPADTMTGRPVEWFVHPVSGEPDAQAQSGVVTASPGFDHAVHVTVDGLKPGTEYRFGFRIGDESIEGRTQTLPERADQLRFVVACCSRWGWPGFERYAAIVEEGAAFVLHLGDYVYESGTTSPAGGTPDPPRECVTLDDYRRRYRQHRLDAGLQRLHANVPFIATWDDHEVVNNAPAAESPARRRAGQQAWREWLPMRWPEPDGAGGDRIDVPNDRLLSVGGLVDLAMVDTRFGGRREAVTDGPEIDPDHGPILNDGQWTGLAHFASRAAAPWFVVASQVQVGPMTLGWLPALRRRPWRRIVNPDQWDGHPAERQRLYGLLARSAGRPVILSGDLHSSWSRVLGDGQEIAHEFTAPSISGDSYGAAFRAGTKLPSAVLRVAMRLFNRGIDLLDLDRHGYLVCDVSAESFTTTFVLGRSHDGEVERIDRTLRRRT
jgi:alkaline phosphatase D